VKQRAKGRTLEAFRWCKPPPSPHFFYIVDSPGDNWDNDNWSQNLIISSWGTPVTHRSRKFNQNSFMTFQVSLILLTDKPMPLKHNLMTTLHGLVTISKLFAGFILINRGIVIVHCLIMRQNANVPFRGKKSKKFTPSAPRYSHLSPLKNESPGSASDQDQDSNLQDQDRDQDSTLKTKTTVHKTVTLLLLTFKTNEQNSLIIKIKLAYIVPAAIPFCPLLALYNF